VPGEFSTAGGVVDVDLQTITECLSDAAEGKGDSEQATVDPAAFADEAINQLYAAIRQLSELDRAVILLYLEEKSYQEIDLPPHMYPHPELGCGC
jgi:DNA-directed RNA polymerase specialized sigma24 family protein